MGRNVGLNKKEEMNIGHLSDGALGCVLATEPIYGYQIWEVFKELICSELDPANMSWPALEQK